MLEVVVEMPCLRHTLHSCLYARKSCMAGGRATVAIDEQYAMSIFLHQFRLLLGIPDISEYEETNAAQHLSLWEKDFLLRTRTVDQLTSAKLTLQVLLAIRFCNLRWLTLFHMCIDWLLNFF